jgi:4-hydroxyphenylacetate 3-monooxygenase
MSLANGEANVLKQFVDQFMAEYDLDGWRAPDLVNPSDINRIFAMPAPKNK